MRSSLARIMPSDHGPDDDAAVDRMILSALDEQQIAAVRLGELDNGPLRRLIERTCREQLARRRARRLESMGSTS